MRTTSFLTALAAASSFAGSAIAATVYDNLTPNGNIAVATRPGVGQSLEIETADDFLLGASTSITSASFIGLIQPGSSGPADILDVVAEIYRVFPNDSDANRNPLVPTRANSPADVAFDSRDSASANGLTFTTTVLSNTFTAANSIGPGGIHPKPNQTTGGNGPVAGEEVRIDVTFSTPFSLPADHYFFVPQVALGGGGQFYWLSASRPISGPGTTPFAPDLQAWTRDSRLAPDWLRVGTDIVGGPTSPTFDLAFNLQGAPVGSVPEPSSVLLFLTAGMLLIGRRSLGRTR